jgi:hypothetical protein
VTGLPWPNLGWSAALIVTLLWIHPLSAQEGVFAASATVERDLATTDAAAILLPVGSQDDGAGYGGTAWLLGHTLAAQANTVLGGLGAEVTVSVERSTTRFTLTALPHVWPEAWTSLNATVFTDPIDLETFRRVLETLSGQMAFREGSPAFDFERESASMLAPPSHEWARNPFGTSESRAVISVQHADLLRADLYHPAAATVGFVGANRGSFPLDTLRPATAAVPAAGLAWLGGDRIALTQEVTSAWISVAYPAPQSTSRTSLEFVAHRIRAALDPHPPDPERYSVDVRIVDAPGGRDRVGGSHLSGGRRPLETGDRRHRGRHGDQPAHGRLFPVGTPSLQVSETPRGRDARVGRSKDRGGPAARRRSPEPIPRYLGARRRDARRGVEQPW